MAYVPPTPGSTTPGQPTPDGVKKQDVHIADLPPEVRRSFLLSMVFFPSIVGATICLIMFLGWWTVFKPKEPLTYAAELRSNDARRRWTAARDLAESIRPDANIYHPEILTALIEIVQNPELDKEIEAWTPSSMIKPGDESRSRLRWFATRMVGHFGGVLKDQKDKDRALDTLVKALDDKELAMFAAEGMSFLKDVRGREALVKTLNEHTDSSVRAAAAKALGAVGFHALANGADEAQLTQFRDPLRSIFSKEKEADVLDNAAIALARLKDPLGKDRLLALTKSEDAVVRDHARRALEALGASPTQPM